MQKYEKDALVIEEALTDIDANGPHEHIWERMLSDVRQEQSEAEDHVQIDQDYLHLQPDENMQQQDVVPTQHK